MIKYINTFLEPLNSLIKKYQKYIWYFFIVLSFLSVSLAFSPETVKLTGEQAMNILWFLLFLPIFSRVFGLSIAQTLMPLRKEIGIFMWVLAWVHTLWYIIPYPEMILDYNFWIEEGFLSYLSFWSLAFICTLPLLITSNNWAIKKLWKKWKTVHRLAYFIVIFTVIHVVLINFSHEFEIVPVIILIIYFIWKILEWKWIKLYNKKEEKYKKWQLWLCVPCGYIYDPVFGDTDSGIVAGTEFVDIPNSWRCPVCGVTKSDFIPYIWDEVIMEWATVVEKKYINPTTIELTIETEQSHTSIPGQFIWFFWEDQKGTFQRSYSIVRQDKNQYVFTIKLNPFGRWARIIEWLAIGDNIRINGIFGNFVIQNSDNPKIFVATGTWLAPIYNMITSLPVENTKILYFSVATEGELFYVNELKEIPNLESHIHITREQIEWYETWRVDIDTIDTPIDTEWYLCGNPKMVTEAVQKLKKRWYKRIYKEEF